MRFSDPMQILRSLPPPVKKVLSIALFAGIVLFGARVCTVESASCELVFKLGRFSADPAEVATELEVRLHDRKGSEVLGSFRKYYQDGPGPDARWPLSLPEGDYRLEGELHTSRRVRSFVKDISVQDEAVITIDLGRELKD